MPDVDTLSRTLVWALVPLGPAIASALSLRDLPPRTRVGAALVCAVPACAFAVLVGWAIGGSAVVAARGRDFAPWEAAIGLGIGEVLVGALVQAALLAGAGVVLRRMPGAGPPIPPPSSSGGTP